MSARVAKRLLVLGWDAADWDIINPLMARGSMPVLQRLVENGVRAELRTLEPTLSPLLWSSIATGKTPDKHGILNFVEPNPNGEGIRTSASTTRRTKALWNILTQSGLRVHALAWYASHPAEPINGICISNVYDKVIAPAPGEHWATPEGAVHGDREFCARLAASRVNPRVKHKELLRALLPASALQAKKDERLTTLAREWGRARSLHAGALEVLATEVAAGRSWDCMMVFHDTIDTIGHHFMELRPPRMDHVSPGDVRALGDVMDRVYVRHDELLGELLKAAGPEVTVMLMSDHGFYSDHRRPVLEQWRKEANAAMEARWHRPEGVIVLSGPGFKRGETIAAPTLLDITPTALVTLGLPIGADMDGRVIAEAFDVPPHIEVIPSWDDQPGEAGLHPAEMRQNPFETREALKQLVELGYMPDLGDDQKALLELTERETKFNLGTVLMTTRRQAAAIPHFAELVAERPDDPRYVIPLAQCQYAAGDLAECVATLRTYLGRGTAFVDARILLAGALQAQGQQSAASEEVDTLEQEHGSRPTMALPLASLFAAQSKWEQADKYYALAVKHDPRNPSIRVEMARSAMAQEQYELAVEICLDATELQMALPDAHYLLGVALAWLGDLENAHASLTNAVTMQPGFLDAWRFLAEVARARGDAGGALDAESKATKLEARPDFRSAGVPEGEVLWGIKAWAEARARASEA